MVMASHPSPMLRLRVAEAGVSAERAKQCPDLSDERRVSESYAPAGGRSLTAPSCSSVKSGISGVSIGHCRNGVQFLLRLASRHA